MDIAIDEQTKLTAVRCALLACPACGCSDAKPFLQSRDWFFVRPPMYQIVRCPGCHLGWLEDAPLQKEMASHYGVDYDRVITAPGDLYPHHWDLVRNKLLQYVQGGSIVDIGCSSGSFLRTLKGDAWKLYGIEMSTAVADQARTSTGADVFVGDVLDAPFQDNAFDAVTGFHVLEHMYDPRKVMAKVLGWLKPGGTFHAYPAQYRFARSAPLRSLLVRLGRPPPSVAVFASRSVGNGPFRGIRRGGANHYPLMLSRRQHPQFARRLETALRNLADSAVQRQPSHISPQDHAEGIPVSLRLHI